MIKTNTEEFMIEIINIFFTRTFWPRTFRPRTFRTGLFTRVDLSDRFFNKKTFLMFSTFVTLTDHLSLQYATVQVMIKSFRVIEVLLNFWSKKLILYKVIKLRGQYSWKPGQDWAAQW